MKMCYEAGHCRASNTTDVSVSWGLFPSAGQVGPWSSVATGKPGKECSRALGRRQGQAVASLCRADPVAEGYGDRRDQEFPGIWSVLGVTSGKVS